MNYFRQIRSGNMSVEPSIGCSSPPPLFSTNIGTKNRRVFTDDNVPSQKYNLICFLIHLLVTYDLILLCPSITSSFSLPYTISRLRIFPLITSHCLMLKRMESSTTHFLPPPVF